MKKSVWLKLFFYLFFRSNKFIEIGTEEVIEEEFKTNKQLADQYPDKKLPIKRIDEFRENIARGTKIIKHRIKESFVISIVTFLSALLTCYLFSFKHLLYLPKILGVISTFLLLWAVFGYAGWEIQTFSGNTLPEKTNNFWFNLLQILGMYLLFLAILLSYIFLIFVF